MEHDPFVPPGSLGDFRCKVCDVRLGSFQIRPGQPTLMSWDETVSRVCKAATPPTRHEDLSMHENCRDAVLDWWYWRQGTKVDPLGIVTEPEYFTLETEAP